MFNFSNHRIPHEILRNMRRVQEHLAPCLWQFAGRCWNTSVSAPPRLPKFGGWFFFLFQLLLYFSSKFLALFQARAVLRIFVLRPEVEKMTLAALNRWAWASSGMKMFVDLWSTIHLSSTEKNGFRSIYLVQYLGESSWTLVVTNLCQLFRQISAPIGGISKQLSS